MIADAAAFANEWVSAWNSHDLDRILSHYSPEIVFLSPIAQQRIGKGRVTGLEALRAYWAGALAATPGLKFEIAEVLAGHECLTILYRNQLGRLVAETFEFGEKGEVVRSFACYA
jgi:ketosteroid isomerase-like protein